MTTQPKHLIVLHPISTATQTLTSALKQHAPQDLYTLHMPSKTTTQDEHKAIQELRDKSNLPPENHLTIPIAGIVQKTWRIIKHYTQGKTNPPKGSPDRKKVVRSVAEENRERLAEIEEQVRKMVAEDQANRLHAGIIPQ